MGGRITLRGQTTDQYACRFAGWMNAPRVGTACYGKVARCPGGRSLSARCAHSSYALWSGTAPCCRGLRGRPVSFARHPLRGHVTPAPAPVQSSETAGQENARRTAESYLDFSAFSRSGLIKQLTFEGYSEADATYAVDAVAVNWNEQAA